MRSVLGEARFRKILYKPTASLWFQTFRIQRFKYIRFLKLQSVMHARRDYTARGREGRTLSFADVTNWWNHFGLCVSNPRTSFWEKAARSSRPRANGERNEKYSGRRELD